MFSLGQAMLGIEPDGRDGRLYVDPELPDWLPDLTIRGLRLGERRFDLRFARTGDRTEVDVLDGDPQAVVRRPFGANLAPLPEFGAAQDAAESSRSAT